MESIDLSQGDQQSGVRAQRSGDGCSRLWAWSITSPLPQGSCHHDQMHDMVNVRPSS